MDNFGIIKSEKNFATSIESLYILKYIFSFLSEKRKLNIIIYNKHLQKMLDTNIENYKRIKGIYRKGGKNGKGKEYNYDLYGGFKFKGEYLNGERNGEGKEYYYGGKLKFKGEYINGERNGNGKEYYDNSKLEYEGEYKNGKRNGKGKEYYSNGKLKYEGEYLNGKKWNGKGYNIKGIIDFEIKNGNGKGIEYDLYGGFNMIFMVDLNLKENI